MNIYEISVFSASIALFVNYIIGKPGKEFSPYEIFSGYTVWLSRRRLKRLGLWDEYLKQYDQSIDSCLDSSQIINFENDFAGILYDAAASFFTWEKAIGMCSVCTGFWISILTGLCFTQNFLHLLQIVVFSHVLIRILNKIL